MPLDPSAYAHLLTEYCLDVQPGQQVLVSTSSLATELVVELQRAIMERDGWPAFRVSLDGLDKASLAYARDLHLDNVSPLEHSDFANSDLFLRVSAPFDVEGMSDLDPSRASRFTKSRSSLFQTRLSKRWAVALWPTQAVATGAGMTLQELTDFVGSATFLDRADPVAAWGELREFQARLIDRLSTVDELHIKTARTDLKMSVRGRTWINSDGRRNMPSGEVFTGPIEDSANGAIFYDIASSPSGVEVHGIELTFKDGKVVSAKAEKGQAYLESMLDADPGARLLGEIGIGTNFGIDRSIGQILFDEKIGGTVHLAVGNSYAESGGVNVSSVHWDMICDLRKGGVLLGDGQIIEENGVFATV